jgi:hypothetical protein
MTDYASLTDAELNRRIAEAAGYTVQRIANPQTMSFREGLHEYILLSPRGVPVHPDGAVGSEESAWATSPRWSNDVGAAMSLLADADVWSWKVEKNTEETIDGSEIVTDYWVEIGRFKRGSESLTRAIALAWLAWKEGAG